MLQPYLLSNDYLSNLTGMRLLRKSSLYPGLFDGQPHLEDWYHLFVGPV